MSPASTRNSNLNVNFSSNQPSSNVVYTVVLSQKVCPMLQFCFVSGLFSTTTLIAGLPHMAIQPKNVLLFFSFFFLGRKSEKLRNK